MWVVGAQRFWGRGGAGKAPVGFGMKKVDVELGLPVLEKKEGNVDVGLPWNRGTIYAEVGALFFLHPSPQFPQHS